MSAKKTRMQTGHHAKVAAKELVYLIYKVATQRELHHTYLFMQIQIGAQKSEEPDLPLEIKVSITNKYRKLCIVQPIIL